MAGADSSSEHLLVRLVSRRHVKASDASIAPHVLAVSNLDLVPQTAPVSMLCLYPPPSTGCGGFSAVIEAFEVGLPGLLNHFFPLAGRIGSDPRSGLPEVRCGNQGAELVVAEATGVALASLDYGTATSSLDRILLPHADDVALSVHLASFACGGFTVAWCTNHVLVDGSALGMLVRAWSELARSGTLAPGGRPSHDRSLFRPRSPPSYSAALHESYVPLDEVAQRQPGGSTVAGAAGGIVKLLYYTEAREVERLRDAASREGHRASRVEALSAYIWKALAGLAGGEGHGRCSMGWVVDGRRRLTAPAGFRDAAVRIYFGNLSTLVVREASAQEILRMPLPEVAAMARETVTAPAYDEYFQELVDWVEEHKERRYAAAASQGVGCPAVIVSALASSALQLDTDFGFGHAALVLPMGAAARLSSGFLRILARPGGDGSWIVAASVWPRLAAALDSDENHLFQPLTAEHLGLVAPQDHRSRL
ncbi:hypothetical protein U9M48_038178 [Paspalum notatum var. saurae]|uniref:Omega-hydroxypalmitate O-feruloyl transferase n=1 Tax=Paspalum notatum var. saurae TaxID=547442 RepID=A0AAQ3UGF3_PASNO